MRSATRATSHRPFLKMHLASSLRLSARCPQGTMASFPGAMTLVLISRFVLQSRREVVIYLIINFSFSAPRKQIDKGVMLGMSPGCSKLIQILLTASQR